MEGFVTHITIEEEGFLCCAAANLTELAVEALPVSLESLNQGLLVIALLNTVQIVFCLWRHQLEAVCMERLTAQSAREEVFSLAKGPTEIAHLLKGEVGVIERATRGV